MTALLVDQPTPSPVRPASGRQRVEPTHVREAERSESWVHVPRQPARATAPALTLLPGGVASQGGVAAQGGAAAASGSTTLVRPAYEWTDRGLAVLLTLVCLVVAAMSVTLVTAFFSVSNEPVAAADGQRAGASAVVVARPGR